MISLFTYTCYACNKRIDRAEDIFCIECSGKLPYTQYGFSKDNVLRDKFKGVINIDFAGALLSYNQNDLVRELLYQLKYNRHTRLGVELGKICAHRYIDAFRSSIDIIIPIPLHPHKLELRGYNQTDLIGDGLSEILGIPILKNILKRSKNTLSQTKFSREERFQNVSHAFEIQNVDKIQGKRLLLIDDVMTTGATLAFAGDVLIQSGIQSLSIFCMASAMDI